MIDGADHSTIAHFIAQGMTYVVNPLDRENLAKMLAKFVGKGDLILNLSVEVSSIDMIEWCQKNGVLYPDTCIEPWADYYDNPKIPEEQRTNYFLRHSVLEEAKKCEERSLSAAHPRRQSRPHQPFRQAGGARHRHARPRREKPKSREAWAKLMQKIGVKIIHVAEHDLQVTDGPKRPNEFCNTWSIPGFVARASSRPNSAGALMRKSSQR